MEMSSVELHFKGIRSGWQGKVDVLNPHCMTNFSFKLVSLISGANGCTPDTMSMKA